MGKVTKSDVEEILSLYEEENASEMDFWVGTDNVCFDNASMGIDIHVILDEEDDTVFNVEVYRLEKTDGYYTTDCSEAILTYTKENNMRKELIKAAVKFWSKYIADPSQARFDNGDDSSTGATMMMMFEMAKPDKFSNSDVELFENELTRIIEDEDIKRISVDYDPDMTLVGACNAMESDVKVVFPVKTRVYMDFDKGVVYASQGYGAADIEIYPGGQ